MAKLSARGRKEWIRAHRLNGARQIEQTIAYMSDGKILVKIRAIGGVEWSGWKAAGKFEIHRPLKPIRDLLISQGWKLETPSWARLPARVEQAFNLFPDPPPLKTPKRRGSRK